VAKSLPVKTLTPKQQKYVDTFDGNVLASSKRAGISLTYAKRLHNDPQFPHVQRALADRILVERKDTILDRQGLQEFWTNLMVAGERDSDRLKASELLAKSLTMFTNRTEVSYPDQIHYTPEQREMLRELAIQRAKQELGRI